MHEWPALPAHRDVHERGDRNARWRVTARVKGAIGGARGMEYLEE